MGGMREEKSLSLHLPEFIMLVNMKRRNDLKKECATKEGSEHIASRWIPSGVSKSLCLSVVKKLLEIEDGGCFLGSTVDTCANSTGPDAESKECEYL
jgi:hypothetical protein